MKKLKSIQENPKHYAVLNSEGNVQGVVLADNSFEDRFLCCIGDSYDTEDVSVTEDKEVSQFDYNFNVVVRITVDGEESYKETFDFQMVEIY